MSRPKREEVFSPDEIACVHVMNRAVRRCFLLGDDPVSGRDSDHRKQVVELDPFSPEFDVPKESSPAACDE